MKQILKKITAAALMIVLVFAMSACGSGSSDEDESGTDWIATCESFLEEYAALTADERESYTEYGDFYAEAAEAWEEYEDELGEFQEILSSKESEDGDVVTVVMETQFENNTADVTIMLLEESEEATYFGIEPDQTMGQLMGAAAVNTVVGIATVFCVLLFLSFLIYLFRYIPSFDGKKKKTDKKAPEKTGPGPVSDAPAASAAVEEDVTDDLELIAVIAAAIAATEDVPADGFVVRSVRKVHRNNWKRS